ncbi:MAG TPA: hypothetical protein VGK12_04430 [Actinomycetota bacterium]
MRRLSFVLALAVCGFAACAPSPVGPAQPVAQELVGGPDGIDAASARATALAFLSAYAHAPAGGLGALRALVVGPDLRSWVRWLGVQNREFDGTIRGDVDLRSASFVAFLPIRKAIGARVDVGASVTFSYEPNDVEPFERTRILDGPITLLRTGTADWRIVDLTRDGVSMDAGITRFDGQTHHLAGVSVRLDSVFRFVPNWQFNVVVTNETSATIGLDPATAALLVRDPGGLQTIETVPSRSLQTIPPGSTVEALIAVPYQDSAHGRALSLPFFGSDGRLRRFLFPLGGLIDALPSPAAGGGSAVPAPG